MATKIHYGDNIFYLETLLKTIRKGLMLEIDADYFRERMTDDILFIGLSLSKIYASLKTNSHLIKKTDYLRSLLRAKRDFADLAQDVLTKKLPLAADLAAGFPKLKICMAEQTREAEEIHVFISNHGQDDSASASELISGEEYRFLLTPAE